MTGMIEMMKKEKTPEKNDLVPNQLIVQRFSSRPVFPVFSTVKLSIWPSTTSAAISIAMTSVPIKVVANERLVLVSSLCDFGGDNKCDTS